MKEIAILGSTGSIGTQAVDVAERMKGSMRVTALAANTNGELLAEQAARLGASRVCLNDPEAAAGYARKFEALGVELHRGPGGMRELVAASRYDLVLNALVGFAGLAPTLEVLERGIDLALANKESLVAGGTLVMAASRASGGNVIPVDSEHSAVFQCLNGEDAARLRRVILTASGGPFRNMTAEELSRVTVAETLAHPTWLMGPKVTVDSATLMNKGLEVLEAHHLFGVALEEVEVLIHPQSVVHSMVEMVDGSVLAQMGVPDMRTPIQYALTFPERASGPAGFLSLVEYGSLSFEEVDTGRFPCLGLAYNAGKAGATFPVALNAANEEAVAAFLGERIGFRSIAAVVERMLEDHDPLPGTTLREIVEADRAAREGARDVIRDLEGTA